MKVDILFCAWNRLQMTTQSWAWLMAHTNWDLVDRVVVYDDGSEDGTQEFLMQYDGTDVQSHGRRIPIEVRISNFGSPPAIMNHYIATAQSQAFVKLDNDIALPGGWLDKLRDVFLKHPEIDLLGMEAGMIAMQGRDGVTSEYGIERCTNIGGVGMMRTKGFKKRPGIPFRGRFGFTEWQVRYDVPRAWIVPDIDCPQLDRLPFEPWLSLTEEYIEKGWSRPWSKYDEKWMAPYWGWMSE